MFDLSLLKELIGMRPVSDDVSAVNGVVKRMMDDLLSAGVFCKLERVGERLALYAAASEEMPDVLFNVHLDVVNGEDSLFKPFERDGRLYGRGSADCLGNAVLLAGLLKRCRNIFRIGVIFSTDEEIGGETTSAMVDRGYGARELAVVLDGGDYGNIVTAQKGTAVIRLKASGKAGHSAYPWLSENAIDKIAAACGKLRARWTEQTGRGWQESLVLCMISGGTAANQVPGSAELTLNLRYVEPGILPVRIREIEEMTGLEAELISGCDVLISPQESIPLRILKENVERELGKECVFTTMCGATDARFLAKLGIPVAIMNSDGAGEHGSEESVRLGSMDELERILFRTIQTISRRTEK